MIIAVSDRMRSTEAISYQPATSKRIQIGSEGKLIALLAGNDAVQSDLWTRLSSSIKQSPPATVLQVADLYSEEIGRHRLRSAERDWLLPFGLNMDEFLRRQREVPEYVIENVYREIESNKPDVQTIITGIDPDGEATIYLYDNSGELSCHTDLGFVAIGCGAAIASSVLMESNYSLFHPYELALFNVFWAKKRSEITPGVGRETDVVTIGYRGNVLEPVPRTIVDRMRGILEDWDEDVSKRGKKYMNQWLDYIKPILSEPVNKPG